MKLAEATLIGEVDAAVVATYVSDAGLDMGFSGVVEDAGRAAGRPACGVGGSCEVDGGGVSRG
jgi:hypothetical protein